MQALSARALAVLIAMLAAYFLVGRAGPRGGRLVRRINRDVLNPIVLRVAGPLAVTVVHHVGRRTGRGYRTPVLAEPTAEGFIVGLPYGADTDWCRNVLAARGALLAHRGHQLRLVGPRVIDLAGARPLMPFGTGLLYRLLGTKAYLVLRYPRDETVTPPPRPAAPRARTHRPSPRRTRAPRRTAPARVPSSR